MADTTASILIPTKNAGGIIAAVLTAVTSQKTSFPYEVIVVDSGSTDQTLSIVAGYPDVRLLTIPAAEFGHGKTRNLAAQASTGEFLVFITHDAIPVSGDWLENLVGPLRRDPSIAGAFGRHVAHQDADVFTKRDLEQHFAGFLAHPTLLSKTTDPARYESDTGWRGLLHFFSNNNSVLRRSVWALHPFPDVEFAEDQIWAATIIEHGYAKLYVPDAVVAHSHAYGPISQLRRAFDEAAAFKTLFGYRLGSSLLRAAQATLWLSVQDVKFGLRNRAPLGIILRRIGQNAGRTMGHYLGTRAERMPEALRRSLSHDRRLMENLRNAHQH